MTVKYGDSFNSFPNSHLQYGTNYNFSSTRVELYSGSDAYSNGYSIKCKNDQYGQTFNSDEYIEVDETSDYVFSVMLKTITNNYLGNPGSGYFGFSPCDVNKLVIAPNHCFRTGTEAVLTRDLNVGDSYFYVDSVTGWYQSATFNHVQMRWLIFPDDHPVYSTPYEYSRLTYNFDGTDIVWTGTDYKIRIVNTTNTPITMPSSIAGYNTTAGTPVGWTVAGATHQYVLGSNIDVPYDWTLRKTGFIGGRGFSDNIVFRYGTKYVRFLAILNYKYRLENAGPSAEFLMDNFLLLKKTPGKEYKNSVFTRTYT